MRPGPPARGAVAGARPEREPASTHQMASSSTAAHDSPTSGVTSRRGSARRSGCGTCVRSGGGGRDVARGVAADHLRARLADEIGITAQVAAHVHRRAELGEAVGLERFDDLRVEVQFFGGRGDRQAGAFTAGAQPLADRTRRGGGAGAGASVSSIEIRCRA